ncbi:hypothetical protein ACIGZJ_36095 [Kitasatospora sp. NPDC052868]|uniref:hypothetical protein n=1 Tax=Kitasatospora sp. NPDC052868 TaxID=3364060 RepID=UPI0037C72AD8
MTDDRALGEQVLELLLPVLEDAVTLVAGEPTRLNHRSGGFRAVLDLRPATGDEQLATALRLRRERHVGSLVFREGDRVRLAVGQHGTSVDEGLEDEGEDCRIPYDVPRGTTGQIVLVRQYVTPLPYRVALDVRGGLELNVAAHDLERV